MSQYAQQPIILEFDHDHGWTVLLPVIHADAVEYESAWVHEASPNHLPTRSAALEEARRLSAKLGLSMEAHEGPEDAATPAESVTAEPAGTRYAKEPILVEFDYDHGWTVLLPIQRGEHVEYEFSCHHEGMGCLPSNRTEAVAEGKALSQKLGLQLKILPDPRRTKLKTAASPLWARLRRSRSQGRGAKLSPSEVAMVCDVIDKEGRHGI